MGYTKINALKIVQAVTIYKVPFASLALLLVAQNATMIFVPLVIPVCLLMEMTVLQLAQ